MTGHSVQVTFLGTGDAFGHGGRLQPCILVAGDDCRFLVDCGASALISLQKYHVAPNSIELILITHLHGDHFGGLPFFILDAQLHSKRQTPLTIAGPTGTRDRLTAAMELMFPGSSKTRQKFDLDICELEPEKPWNFKSIQVRSYLMQHPCGDPPLGFRIDCSGKIIAHTGDTQWTDTIVPLAGQADLLIAEAYFFNKPIKNHLNYETLMAHYQELQPKRTVLTHMSRDMLDRLDEIDLEAAEDGQTIHI